MPVIEAKFNYKPHHKQRLLHNAPCSFDHISITLFGGARGSGKSAGILMDAIFFAMTYPGAKCIIFREKLDAVKQSFVDKLPALFPEVQGGRKIYAYKEKGSIHPNRTMVFENGSYITFQRAANLTEALTFRGWECHYLGVDECTLIEEKALQFLSSCVRSAEITNPYTKKPLKIPTKIVYGANPGGISHKYIKREFIDPTVIALDKHTMTPIKTKDHIKEDQHPIEKDKKIITHIRFIPATYKDNPYLSPAYIANLMNQPEHIRKRDIHGNWEIVAGRMFDIPDEMKISQRDAAIAIREAGQQMEVFISIDWGYRPSYHSAHWYAILPDHRIICFQELYGQELIFEDFVAEVAKMSKGYEISGTLLPHDMFREGDRYRDQVGRIIGVTKAEVFDNWELRAISVESGKGKVQMRYDKIHSSMELKCCDGIHKFRISTACPMLLEEIETAVYDDNNVGQIAKNCRDHALDDYGLFLVYYSDDIEPIVVDKKSRDYRTKLQKRIEEHELYLDERAKNDDLYIETYYEI